MKIRVSNSVVIANALAGIAATILIDGRTNHNTYSVPFHYCFEDSVCHIRLSFIQGKRLRDAELIIIDEAPMTNNDVLHAIDRLI